MEVTPPPVWCPKGGRIKAFKEGDLPSPEGPRSRGWDRPEENHLFCYDFSQLLS